MTGFLKNISLIVFLLGLNFSSIKCQEPCEDHSDGIIYFLTEFMPIPNISYSEIESLINKNINIDSHDLENGDFIYLSLFINCKGEMYDIKLPRCQKQKLKKDINDLLINRFTWKPAIRGSQKVDIEMTYKLTVMENKLRFNEETIKMYEKRDRKTLRKLEKMEKRRNKN